MVDQIPVLYSFRRCPYAMRARMAIFYARAPCSLREVILRDKPDEMLAASPKATVPVLVLGTGSVIDESLDIMDWALARNDPDGWLTDSDTAKQLIKESDGPFKHHLDRYKYGTRYEEQTPEFHRSQGEVFLNKLNTVLSETDYLTGPGINLADIAVFPFIRQFANTDRTWFDGLDLPALHKWLTRHQQSDLFQSVMAKYPQWKTGDEDVQFVV